jgi:hypothetical protein
VLACTAAAHNCDFSSSNLNSAYFAHADWVINKAAEKGILVLLAPIYAGFPGTEEGWRQEMVANGAAKLASYGDFLGERYKNYTNILWVESGDFNPPDNNFRNLVRAVANSIKLKMGAALQTFHGERHTPALGFWGTTETWLTVNDIYTDENDVFSMARTEYQRAGTTMPFFMFENRYENEGTPAADAALVRTQSYQAMLSGATGHVMGNFPVWDFAPNWELALNSGGASTLKYLRMLFETRAWHTLQPDLSNTFLTGGIGADKDRAVAARAAGGAFALAYVPSVRQISINPSQLTGPNVQAKWCDPTNGVCTAAGAPFAKSSGSKNFTPVGNNSGNFGDWVLLLESVQ